MDSGEVVLAQQQDIASIPNPSVQSSRNVIFRYREAVLYPGLPVR